MGLPGFGPALHCLWHTLKKQACSAPSTMICNMLLFITCRIFKVEFVKSIVNLFFCPKAVSMLSSFGCTLCVCESTMGLFSCWWDGLACFPGESHSCSAVGNFQQDMAINSHRLHTHTPQELSTFASLTWPGKITYKEVNNFRRWNSCWWNTLYYVWFCFLFK